jgi:hypothetical protein
MPAFVPRLTNFLILCLVVILLLHWSLCFRMCRDLPLIPLVIRNIMSDSSMILVDLHGSIFSVINPRCFNSLKNFNVLLNGCLTVKIFLCRPIGEVNMRGSTLFSMLLASPTMYPVLTLINKMVQRNRSIAILSSWDLLYSNHFIVCLVPLLIIPTYVSLGVPVGPT